MDARPQLASNHRYVHETAREAADPLGSDDAAEGTVAQPTRPGGLELGERKCEEQSTASPTMFSTRTALQCREGDAVATARFK